MSWFISLNDVPAAAFTERIGHAVEGARAANPSMFTPETEEQVTQAVTAAHAIVTSGAVGKGAVSVVLSGHANPGHLPRAGWSTDGVRIMVEAVAPQED